MTNEEQIAAPTRRQLREIERRTGKRPVVAADFDLGELYDTARIERNAFGSVVSVVPAEVSVASAEVATAETAACALADGRSMSIRAIKPARLVAQERRRRAVAGLSAAAAVAGVAAAGLALPATSDAPSAVDAHSANLSAALKPAAAPKAEAATPVAAPAKLDATAAAPTDAEIAAAAKAEAVKPADYSVTSLDAPTAAGVEAPIVVAAEQDGPAASNAGGTSNAARGGAAPSAVSNNDAAPAPQNLSNTSEVRRAIVALARSYVGVVPYSMGNTPQSGFACDGLVQWVYSHTAGISLPRGVGSQAASGYVTSNPQPGDLVVFGGHHIGIYAGNGRIIDSPDFGRYVSERQIWNESHYFVSILG